MYSAADLIPDVQDDPLPPRAASVLIKCCDAINKSVCSTREKSLRFEQELVLNRSPRVCFLRLGCTLTLGFEEELENVCFPAALSLMEESACRGGRFDLPGKGLRQDLLSCFSAGTHLPSLPLEISALLE